MYKHIFGPVPSRRLGMSLGVDLVPHKVCSLDCVYCECGETTELGTVRRKLVDIDEVCGELDRYFETNPEPDYATFSGAGEPTLNSGLGRVIRHIKKLKPALPVALLTNGTLFDDPAVRQEASGADLVLPSLDAVSTEVFRKINRPAAGLEPERMISGLEEFRRSYSGMIWLEVMILPGYNDSPEEIELLGQAAARIKPDRVQLNTLDRPGAVPGLVPAGYDFLEEIISLWGMDNVEIIAPVESRRETRAYRTDTEEAIMGLVSRRPCTADDLSSLLGIRLNEVNKYLGVLEHDGRLSTERQARGVFYRAAAN